MPTKQFKINIYDVELEHNGNGQPTQFEDAVGETVRQGLENREKTISGKIRRLDTIGQRSGILLLNFVTFEYSGPGRVRSQQPVNPIVLAEDESFAPETAMLYDSATNLAFLESSLGSMGPGAVVDYFEKFAAKGTEYTLRPRSDNNAGARARRHQTIRNLKMRIALGPMTDLDRAAGIDPLKAFGANYGAGYIDIEIKSERPRGRSLILGQVQDLIGHFSGGNRDMPQITQLLVTGREHDDDPLEIIDLIQHREKRQILLEIDSGTRKVPHRVRWDALLAAHNAFIHS